MTVSIEVLTAQWAADDDVYTGGVHADVKITKKNAPLFAGAEAAGVIVVLDATDDTRALLAGHVQSQEDGEAEYERAQQDGRWSEGNVAQFDLDVASGVRSDSLAGGEQE